MKYGFKILLAIFATAIFAACSTEYEEGGKSGDDSTISISTRGALFPDDLDNTIRSLRIIAFSKNGVVKNNRLYPTSELSETILHTITSGTYDFAFIANEPSSMSGSLQSIANYTELTIVKVHNDYIYSNLAIPMTAYIEDVLVKADNKVVISGVEYSRWEVSLQRIAVRVDIEFLSSSDLSTEFHTLLFSGLPSEVALLPDNANYTGSTHIRSYPYPGIMGSYETIPADKLGSYAWGLKVNRIIIPSYMFTPKNQPSKAVKLVFLYNSLPTQSVTIGQNEAGGDYTLPRNYHYTVKVTRSNSPLKVNISAKPWVTENIGGDIENRILNVTSIVPNVNALKTARIHFYSNQKSVTVEENGFRGESGSTVFPVNSIFDDLAGATASNIVYNSATGEGYMDISPVDITESKYRICLNAGGLRREVTVDVSEPDIVAVDWDESPFVGTFHKHNQKGERVIFGGSAGNWVAEVEDWTGGENFVVLSKKRSADPNFATNNPGNAENYPVEGNLTSVRGSGTIYFRVGLTGTLPYETSAPRYAKIKITYTVNSQLKTSYIYVRQGQEPDWIFTRDQTIGGSNDFSTLTRSYAQKFGVYNLTVPTPTVSKYIFGAFEKAKFVDYPTQAGYMFTFYKKTAYWPSTAGTPGFETTDDSSIALGTWSDSWETCPGGYRRPKNRPYLAMPDYSYNTMQYSEIMQSLYQSGPSVNTIYSGSLLYKGSINWGYYADGFFDRLKRPDSFAANIGPDVACRGSIAYNAQTLHSVFFPAVGRYNSAGSYAFAGEQGHYWTQTPYNSGDSNATISAAYRFTKDGAAVIHNMSSRNGGNAIRCIKITDN